MSVKLWWNWTANPVQACGGISRVPSTDSAREWLVERSAKAAGAIGILAVSALLVSACGSKKVTFQISQDGLAAVQEAAPSSEYALFVSSKKIPTTASDLERYSISDCSGELMQVALSLSEMNNGAARGNPLMRTRVYQLMAGILQGIGTSHGDIKLVGCGKNPTDIETLIEDKPLIAVVRREKGAPKGAVEISFK